MKSSFTKVIEDWYSANKRDLPWRNTRNPYYIWISEIILQQTRVVQGYDYFLRFIEQFPDVESLANADEDDVMRCWQGLGYYSRARNLHQAAQSMNGVFPVTYEGVRALKGVGDYTAAAICSFAYDMSYAVVDGNVYRVLSRFLGIDTPIDSSYGKKLFASLADEYLDKKNPALYNQAIMDFGAIQCTPSSPNCMFCPLCGECAAALNGTVEQLPVKQHRTKVTNRYFTYLLVYIGDEVLIHKRTGKDIWCNLYEFPLIESDHPLTTEELVENKEFLSMIPQGVIPNVSVWKKSVKHVLSHRVIYADFYKICLPEGSSFRSEFSKVLTDDLSHYAFPQLIQALLLSEK